jgi:hypothetical protein
MRNLELVLTMHGTAELVNVSTDNIEWASDSDDEFRDHQPNELLGEDDVDDVLEYLAQNDIITQEEHQAFEDESLPVYEESEGDPDEETGEFDDETVND